MKTSGNEPRFQLEAAATFGLEAVVRDELAALGVTVTGTLDRRVLFEGTPRDIARCNMGLRTADRVWLRMASFAAADFDSLYEGVRGAPWTQLLPRNAAVIVKARSSGSRLTAVPSIQSVWERRRSSMRSWAAAAATPRSGPRKQGRCLPLRYPFSATLHQFSWTPRVRASTSGATGPRQAPRRFTKTWPPPWCFFPAGPRRDRSPIRCAGRERSPSRRR